MKDLSLRAIDGRLMLSTGYLGPGLDSNKGKISVLDVRDDASI